MTSVSKRINSRRRLAALTFLSNISLDGTHRDTTLGVLNLNLHRVRKDGFGKSQDPSSMLIADDEASEESESVVHAAFAKLEAEHVPTKSRDRMHKFVCDAKSRLCNLSQKRKHLIHQKSVDSYGLPAGKSTESLVTPGCRSRKASMCPSECSFPATVEIRLVKSLKDRRMHNERIVLFSCKKAPFVLFSVLPFHRSHIHSTLKGELRNDIIRRRHASSMRQLSIISDGTDPLDLLALLGVEKPQEGQDVSFSQLLAPSAGVHHNPSDVDHLFRFSHQAANHSFDRCSTPRLRTEKHSEKDESCSTLLHGTAYNPNLLDDPELIAGKHSTLLVFPSYITSIIDYVKPSDLKKDLNDKFKDRFPNVQLTLSKLRSLKREMYKIARHECNIDLSIVAQAFVYFEKLILKILVNKQNRKLCAGACLLLSAKLNDVKGSDLRNLLEKIEAAFRVNRKDLMNLEFGVLVALEFSLLLSSYEILPHYQRLVYES